MSRTSMIMRPLAACVAGAVLFCVGSAQAGSPRQEYVAEVGSAVRTDDFGELLVKFRDDVPEYMQQSLVTLAEGRVMRKLESIHGARVKVPARRLQTILGYLRSLPEVEDAQPNYLRYADVTMCSSRRFGGCRGSVRRRPGTSPLAVPTWWSPCSTPVWH